MRNYKMEKNLTGKENWPEIPSVFIAGIPEEKSIPAGLSPEEKRSIIESWSKVAILRVSSPETTKFYAGFSTKNKTQLLKHEFETNLDLGMRIGADDIVFLALPLNIEKELKLELIEIADINDEKYSNLILI